jgi:hypothetical protein
MLSYTMRAGFQRIWLSALAKFVSWDENASLKTPHGAYSFPLGRNGYLKNKTRDCFYIWKHFCIFIRFK